MLTDHLPRISLGHLPTPLEELPRLTRALGGPRLFIKRDDQTGLAGGGNKTRKLEFSVAEALRQGADTLITVGGVQSNHCRQTAAAAARCGLRLRRGAARARARCLERQPAARPSAGRAGGVLRRPDAGRSRRGRGEGAEGRRPSSARHSGGRVERHRRGGVRGGHRGVGRPAEGAQAPRGSRRVCQQLLRDAGGAVRGRESDRLQGPARGHRDRLSAPRASGRGGRACRSTIHRLGLELSFAPEEVVAYDGYLGAGYAIMGEPEREAISLVARTKGSCWTRCTRVAPWRG